MDRKRVISYLRDCDLAELSGILNSVLPVRSEELEEDSVEIKLVLAEVSRVSDQKDWNFAVISKPNTEIKDYKNWAFGNGEPFVQEGECEICKIKLCSHAKESKCPLCDSAIKLT